MNPSRPPEYLHPTPPALLHFVDILAETATRDRVHVTVQRVYATSRLRVNDSHHTVGSVRIHQITSSQTRLQRYLLPRGERGKGDRNVRQRHTVQHAHRIRLGGRATNPEKRV